MGAVMHLLLQWSFLLIMDFSSLLAGSQSAGFTHCLLRPFKDSTSGKEHNKNSALTYTFSRLGGSESVSSFYKIKYAICTQSPNNTISLALRLAPSLRSAVSRALALCFLGDPGWNSSLCRRPAQGFCTVRPALWEWGGISPSVQSCTPCTRTKCCPLEVKV